MSPPLPPASAPIFCNASKSRRASFIGAMLGSFLGVLAAVGVVMAACPPVPAPASTDTPAVPVVVPSTTIVAPPVMPAPATATVDPTVSQSRSL